MHTVIIDSIISILGFSGGSGYKSLPAMQESWVWSLGWEDPLEKGKATNSSILAWRIPWVAKSQTWLSDFHFILASEKNSENMHELAKAMATPTPVLLPGKSHGQRNLVGYTPRGSKESDTTERLHFKLMKTEDHMYFLDFWVSSEKLPKLPGNVSWNG